MGLQFIGGKKSTDLNVLSSLPSNKKENRIQPGYSSAQLFTTPARGALPARSGSGEMSKLKHRAQPRSVTWKGKKLSKRSMPASTHASTSSGRPTPCSNLRGCTQTDTTIGVEI